jgi:hypothetical protein
MAKLRSYVHVPVDLDWVVYGPDDEVPAEHAALITNPKAWAVPPDDETEASAAPQVDGEPPRSGAGSSKEAWAAFAEAHGVAVSDEDKRDDIIAALVDADVIDE